MRRVMGAARVRLDDDAIEALLEDAFPDVPAEDVEDYMSTLQRVSRDVAPVARRVLPGVARGAVQGGATAGPAGAFAGGLLGGASSLVGGTARAASTPAQGPVRAPAPMPPGSRGASAAAGTPREAAALLVALLSRPETTEALLALTLAGAGRVSVRVGAFEVPPAAFANAIAELAAVAASDELAAEHDVPQHLFDDVGQPRGDLANPAERAAILLADLASIAEDEADDDVAPDEADIADESWADAVDVYEDAVRGWHRG